MGRQAQLGGLSLLAFGRVELKVVNIETATDGSDKCVPILA